MYLLVLLLPLLSTIFAGLFGRKIGGRGSSIISTALIASTFLISCFIFFEVALLKTPCLIQLGSWFITETYNLYWGFLFDTLTAVMLIVVTSISSLVHFYSTEYMRHDPHLSRFMSYLSFFTFFMLILVTADNFIQMFVGWEGVGLCSYLLINFWYGRIQANKAALKAMIVNRVGDFGLGLAIFTIYFYYQTVDYSVVFSLTPFFSNTQILFLGYKFYLLDFIGLFLFIGAVGKSAQVGLHTWLPDAMEGPTPVSALIHAATMVTAGVFLLCRCSLLLEYAPHVSVVITVVGGMTAFFAATTGLLQNDLKRVIAYSTCSQLGYMVFAAGLSSYSVSVFHLSNHAFFKALLFLGAGSVIHAMGDEQDMRKMGGLVKILPFTYATMLVGSLALMGFPFLTGFYSKDLILELVWGSFTVEGRFVYTLGVLAAFFTAFYSVRLLGLTFLRTPNGRRYFYEHAHESSFPMALPLFLLSFGSIFIGYLSRDMFVGLGTDFWGNALFTLPTNQFILEAEFLESHIKLIPLVFSFSGLGLGLFFYLKRFETLFALKSTSQGRFLYTFLNRKWFFDKVYNDFVSQGLLHLSYKYTYQNLDRGFFEFLGPKGISKQLYFYFKKLSRSTLSFVYHYFIIMFVFLAIILFIFGNWYFILGFVELPVIIVLFLTLFFYFI